jgi:hypothetical protein
MKKVSALIVTFILFFTLLQGCKKNELKYSCNPVAHQYALVNLSGNQTISRDSLVKLEKDFQFAVWHSMSSDNKKRIFDEKINKVLEEESLMPKERDYLLTIKNYYEEDMYENPDSNYFNSLERYAIDTLGWTVNQITVYVGMWATLEEINRELEPGYLPNRTTNPDCHCKYDIACSWAYGGCVDTKTCQMAIGCGLLGTSKCSGLCDEYNKGLVPIDHQ